MPVGNCSVNRHVIVVFVSRAAVRKANVAVGSIINAFLPLVKIDQSSVALFWNIVALVTRDGDIPRNKSVCMRCFQKKKPTRAGVTDVIGKSPVCASEGLVG